jgi:hypothetical protein
MKNAYLLFRLLIVLLVYLTACGDKKNDPQPPTKTDILTAKIWKMNRVLGNGVDVTDMVAEMPELSQFKDMRFKFNADGSYTLTSAGGTQAGTWAFTENETKIVLDPNTDNTQTLEIVELKDNSTKFRTSMEMPPFGQAMFTLEMVPA